MNRREFFAAAAVLPVVASAEPIDVWPDNQTEFGGIFDLLAHPEADPRVWPLIDEVLAEIDRHTGLTDLLYGETKVLPG